MLLLFFVWFDDGLIGLTGTLIFATRKKIDGYLCKT
jgi:hypothetical protein